MGDADETAAGKAAERPPTQAAETAGEQPTQAAEPGTENKTESIHAWSLAHDSDDDTEVMQRRSWIIPAIVAAAAVTLAAATGLGIWKWSHHDGDPQFSTGPSTFSNKPSAGLAPPPAPPQTVTVQVPAPTPTLIPEPTPLLTDQDRQFLGTLRKAGIEYPYSNPGYPIVEAHAVCQYESTHQQPAPEVDKSAQGGKWVEQNTIWYGSNAVGFSSLAQQTYCPQFLDGEY
jgi:hypothetical protein